MPSIHGKLRPSTDCHHGAIKITQEIIYDFLSTYICTQLLNRICPYKEKSWLELNKDKGCLSQLNTPLPCSRSRSGYRNCDLLLLPLA
jgi:hypothetical protein